MHYLLYSITNFTFYFLPPPIFTFFYFYFLFILYFYLLFSLSILFPIFYFYLLFSLPIFAFYFYFFLFLFFYFYFYLCLLFLPPITSIILFFILFFQVIKLKNFKRKKNGIEQEFVKGNVFYTYLVVDCVRQSFSILLGYSSCFWGP